MSVCACRQQAEQQRQLVQYHDAAKREVSGVRRRCAEEVARALQRAAEKQGFFHTAPHQICQARIQADWVHPFQPEDTEYTCWSSHDPDDSTHGAHCLLCWCIQYSAAERCDGQG